MCRFHYGPLCLDHIEIYMQNKIVLTFMCASAALGPGHACRTQKQSELRYFLFQKPTLLLHRKNINATINVTIS